MNSRILGAGSISLSALFFASYGVWAQLMHAVFDPFSQAWIRGLLILLVLVPAGWYVKAYRRMERTDWLWLGLIALLGGLNQAPYYYGFGHLSVGTATLLFYVALVIGSYLIGWYFFGERITKVKLVALGLALVSLGWMYEFSLQPEQLLAAGMSIMAGLMGAGVAILPKKLSGSYSTIQILTGDFVAIFVINLLIWTALLAMNGAVSSGKELLWSLQFMPVAWQAQLGYGAAMLLANGLVIYGFRYLDATIGGLIGLLEVVFAGLLGWIVFGEELSLAWIMSSGLIVIAAGLPDMIEIWGRRRIFVWHN